MFHCHYFVALASESTKHYDVAPKFSSYDQTCEQATVALEADISLCLNTVAFPS